MKNNILDISFELLQKYNVQGPRYTSYPPAPSWKSDLTENQYQGLVDKSNKSDRPLSIYIHLPFCEHLCYFCACTTVITGKSHKLEDPYVDILIKEIEMWSRSIDTNRPITQFHLGGGTPTYMSPQNLERIFNTFKKKFKMDSDVEVGVEIDPRVTTVNHLESLYQLGFNRLSMGVQDFNPLVQKTINRIQTPEATRELVEKSKLLGFLSVNIDLIYGLPHQTPETFAETIRTILDIKPTRLAVYSYAHVPWMKRYQDIFADALPDGERKFKIFKTALQIFLEAGYEYIGMDHFARPEDEMAVARKQRTLWRNFMGYTTKAGTDLFGFGMSAISSLQNGFLQNERQLKPYQDAISSGKLATMRGFEMSPDDLLRSRAIQSLMCHAKLVKKELADDFDQYFSSSLEKLSELEKDGLVVLTEEEIQPTDLGRLFLRNLAMPFDAYLPEPGDKKIFSRTV